MNWDEEMPGTGTKPTLPATREATSCRKEGQHNVELMDKPIRETRSVEIMIDESKNRCGRKNSVSKKVIEDWFGSVECDIVVGAPGRDRSCVGFRDHGINLKHQHKSKTKS